MSVKNSAGRRNMTIQKRKTFIVCVLSIAALMALGVRVGYLMIMCSEHYTELAQMLHERERACGQQDSLHHISDTQPDKRA